MLDLINNHPTNLASGPPVVARLSQFGNGIELVNDGPSGGSALTVTKLNSSTAAVDLGLLSSTSRRRVVAPINGASATATLSPTGGNNDFVISAVGSGTLLNGVTIHFPDDGVGGKQFGRLQRVDANVDVRRRPGDDDGRGHRRPARRQSDVRGFARRRSTELRANTGAGTLGTLPADVVLSGGTADVLTGRDPNPQEVNGIFTALYPIARRDSIGRPGGDRTGRRTARRGDAEPDVRAGRLGKPAERARRHSEPHRRRNDVDSEDAFARRSKSTSRSRFGIWR